MRLIVVDRFCANSRVCCRLTTPRSAPPHSKTASSICGGFLPETRWYALCPPSLIFDALAWFTASQSSSKSVHVCTSGPSCVSSCSSLPSNPCLHVLSCHSSTGPPVVSLQVLAHRFQLSPRKCLSSSCAAGRQQGCEAFHLTVTDCFCMRSSGFFPDSAGE